MTAEPLTKQKVQVLGHAMAYHESGEGEPILFLHGNPTSSYLWRNVIPELRDMGRLLVPDLIGMGDSEKLPNPSAETYRFVTHSEYLSAFIDKVIGPDRPLLLVGHDWGPALAFNWAYQHRNRVRGIVYMEALVRPLAGWHEWTAAQSLFLGFRSNAGESMILDRNLFVERVLPGSNIRKLSEGVRGGAPRPMPAA
jgi:haloalkane dehalogenase